MYEDLLDQIVLRLKGTEEDPINFGTIPKFQVEKLPQYRAEYDKLKVNQPGRIYVAFGMHRFGTEKEPTNALLGIAVQDSDPYVTLSLAVKGLYGTQGTLTYIGLTVGLLIGLPFSWGGELSMFSVDLLAFEDSTWHYQIIMRVRDFPVVPIDNFRQGIDSDVLLRKITYHNDRTGETTVVEELEEPII